MAQSLRSKQGRAWTLISNPGYNCCALPLASVGMTLPGCIPKTKHEQKSCQLIHSRKTQLVKLSSTKIQIQGKQLWRLVVIYKCSQYGINYNWPGIPNPSKNCVESCRVQKTCCTVLRPCVSLAKPEQKRCELMQKCPKKLILYLILG